MIFKSITKFDDILKKDSDYNQNQIYWLIINNYQKLAEIVALFEFDQDKFRDKSSLFNHT